MTTLNLASTASEGAARWPAAIALRLGTEQLSFAELDAKSAKVASLLTAKGVAPGDRVGLMLPNVLEFPVIYFGVLRAGAVVVPLNVLLKRREICFYLEDSEASLLFAWHDFAAEARIGAEEAGVELVEVGQGEFEGLVDAAEPTPELAATRADETAVILYTSGTTGKPKGAMLTHFNLSWNADTVGRTTCLIETGNVVLGALPLFHSFGQTVSMNASLRAGATLTLLPRFDPAEALEIIERERVTHFYGVPTMFGEMLYAAGPEVDLSTLRICITGGAAMPAEVLRGFEGRFGCELLEGYGLSETSPTSCVNHPGRPTKVGSIGTPLEEVEMKVVDDRDLELPQGEVGEIVIRGPNVMKGYWRRPEETAEAMRGGWFHTGDLAKIDEEGYFFIVDRKKDMIIRGGNNVYPREIEELLYAHPKIREAAVVGVPDPKWGEEIGAAVVLAPGESMQPEDVSAYVKERLAAYKYPRIVKFLDELPKGPTGKILKRGIELTGRVDEGSAVAKP